MSSHLMNNHQPHAYRQHARAHCTLSAFPHCRLCSSGDAKSHNSTTSAENCAKSSKRLQQLMSTTTSLKAYERSILFNLWVTCVENTRNSFHSYSWHGWLNHWPSSHQPPQPVVGRALAHVSWSRHPSVSSTPPKLVEKVFQLLRAHNHGVRCDSLWRDTSPLPEHWDIPCCRISPLPLLRQPQAGKEVTGWHYMFNGQIGNMSKRKNIKVYLKF